MKKTLVLICSLAAVAQAADITFTYDPATNLASTAVTATPTASGATAGSVTLTGATSLKTGGYADNLFTPSINVGNNNTWTYTLSFTVLSDMTTDSVSVAMITSNASGNTQNTGRKYSNTLTLAGGELNLAPVTVAGEYGSDSTTPTSPVYDINAGEVTDGSGAIVTFALGQEVTLAAGETYTLTLEATRGAETNGYFVGISAIQVNEVVPEPATATLSLLALAGLAARRRRK